MQSKVQINLYSFYKSRSKTYMQPDLEISLYSSYKSQINTSCSWRVRKQQQRKQQYETLPHAVSDYKKQWSEVSDGVS